MQKVPYKIVEKPHWPGREKWQINSEKYCGKIQIFDRKEAKCSVHKHKLKDEVMYCNKGSFKIVYGWSTDVSQHDEVVQKEGDSFHIQQDQWHQIVALDYASELIEFSTQHFDSDSYRQQDWEGE